MVPPEPRAPAPAATKQEEEEVEDCLGCRLTGSLTLLGVSAYFLNERSKLPRHDLGQRRWLLACGGVFALAGIWRATTDRFAERKATEADVATSTSASAGSSA